MVMDMNENQMIFAIDPGDVASAYAIIEMPDFKLYDRGKVNNYELLELLEKYKWVMPDVFAIEMIASYGLPVGKNVFETCVWIGRFIQAISPKKHTYVYRKEEKLCICGSLKAKDSNIRQALIDRYAKHDFKNGKGTKKNPDTFYGVSKDVWQAIAVGVTCYEKEQGDEDGAK